MLADSSPEPSRPTSRPRALSRTRQSVGFSPGSGGSGSGYPASKTPPRRPATSPSMPPAAAPRSALGGTSVNPLNRAVKFSDPEPTGSGASRPGGGGQVLRVHADDDGRGGADGLATILQRRTAVGAALGGGGGVAGDSSWQRQLSRQLEQVAGRLGAVQQLPVASLLQEVQSIELQVRELGKQLAKSAAH